LEQQERDQEENPRALEPLAQIPIEQERITQNGAEREQIRLHFNSNPRDQDPAAQSPFQKKTRAGFCLWISSLAGDLIEVLSFVVVFFV
jgi:hypothetical protein